MKPKGYLDVRSGLKSFETRQCASGITAALPPTDVVAADPNFNVRTGGDVAAAATFFDQIKTFALNGQSTTTALPAPPCTQQAPYNSIGDRPRADAIPARQAFPVGGRGLGGRPSI